MFRRWWIRYSDGGLATGRTRLGWWLAPDIGVQAVVRKGSGPNSGWIGGEGVEGWTGQRVYDPFGWGPKYGNLIPDERYWEIWREALGNG